jgi:hypothetical protein
VYVLSFVCFLKRKKEECHRAGWIWDGEDLGGIGGGENHDENIAPENNCLSIKKKRTGSKVFLQSLPFLCPFRKAKQEVGMHVSALSSQTPFCLLE